MFSLLLAFILYTASIGSLVKYKEFLFGSVSGTDNATGPFGSTAIPQGQGVDAKTQAAIDQQVKNHSASGGGMSDLQTGLEIAGTVAMFL